MRAINAIEESDVVFLMVDATRGLEAQDLSIFSLAAKRKKGVVILVNKWDLVEDKKLILRLISLRRYMKKQLHLLIYRWCICLLLLSNEL